MKTFPDETAPRYLLRDRDAIDGECFTRSIPNMGIREVIIAPRAPWQNAFVERVIGSIRRECLDHVIVLSEAHLGRILRAYLAYYNTARPHQSLDNNSPQPREVHPPDLGRVVSIPRSVGSIASTSGRPDHRDRDPPLARSLHGRVCGRLPLRPFKSASRRCGLGPWAIEPSVEPPRHWPTRFLTGTARPMGLHHPRGLPDPGRALQR